MTVWPVVAAGGAAVTAMSLWVAIAPVPERTSSQAELVPGQQTFPPRAPAWLRRRIEVRAVAAALPVLLEVVARALRSGQSARVALAEAGGSVSGPLSADIHAIARRLAVGATFHAALEQWVEHRVEVPGVRLAASAIALAEDSGGSVAAAVDGVADTLREEQALAAEVRSLAAQARASAGLIVALPLVFALMAAAADPRVLGFLTGTGVGRTCLMLGVGLDVVALVWMHRIVDGIAR